MVCFQRQEEEWQDSQVITARNGSLDIKMIQGKYWWDQEQWVYRADRIHASCSPVFESIDIPPSRMSFVLRNDSFGQCRSARQEAHIRRYGVRAVTYIYFTLQRLQLNTEYVMAEARYGEYKTWDAGLHAQPSRTRQKLVNAQVTSCAVIVHVLCL
jgi:hypothetical protein